MRNKIIAGLIALFLIVNGMIIAAVGQSVGTPPTADFTPIEETIEAENLLFSASPAVKQEEGEEIETPIKEEVETLIKEEDVENIEFNPPPVQEQIISWEYAPIPSSVKTYESCYAITYKPSKQYALLHGDNKLIYRQDGMIQDEDGYLAAALGSYFGPIGSKWIFLLEREDGAQHELKIIKADQKQDRHTINTINGKANTDIIEFIVNDKVMPKAKNGLVYSGNFNNCPAFNGTVIAWRENI